MALFATQVWHYFYGYLHLNMDCYLAGFDPLFFHKGILNFKELPLLQYIKIYKRFYTHLKPEHPPKSTTV
jgi:hypothetical protein